MNSLFDITKVHEERKTRLFTAENVYGEKGKGAMAEVSPEPMEEVKRIGQMWIENVNARELGQGWKVRPGIKLDVGKETTIVDTDGPAAFTHIWITVDRRWYRDIILRMYWDNEETPSVECPLGDFFCCGWKAELNITGIAINTNPHGGMNCYLPMPFRKHAKVTVENRAFEIIDGFFYAFSCEERPVDEKEAYFHAQFRRTNPLTAGEEYVILDGVKGQGHYVGTQMAWQQNNEGWWGEGEFKAYIDGDGKFPTYCGTGTEDYFGGAWGFGHSYSAPFLGYNTVNERCGVGGRFSLYRFHLLDPIRFSQDLRVTIQALGWRDGGRYLALQDDISSVAYWYQLEPHAAFPKLGSKDDLEII